MHKPEGGYSPGTVLKLSMLEYSEIPSAWSGWMSSRDAIQSLSTLRCSVVVSWGSVTHHLHDWSRCSSLVLLLWETPWPKASWVRKMVFHLILYSRSWKEGKTDTGGRDHQRVECCLPACSPWLVQSAQPGKDHLPKDGLPAVGQACSG